MESQNSSRFWRADCQTETAVSLTANEASKVVGLRIGKLLRYCGFSVTLFYDMSMMFYKNCVYN